MNKAHDIVARTAKLARMRGMSPEGRAHLNEHNRQRTDWVGTCRKCGARLHGSIKDLEEHRCDIV